MNAAAASGPQGNAMKTAVITGTGLYRPPHVITNAELVVSYNAYADLQNAKHAAAIAAGARQPLPHSSVEFIEKASGIRQRYVIDKAGVLDPARMRPYFEPRGDDAGIFFTRIFTVASRRRVCEHAYQQTRADLLARHDELGATLAST